MYGDTMMTMAVNTSSNTDSNNSIEEAMALHREALDLRYFLSLHDFQLHDKSDDEMRSASPTASKETTHNPEPHSELRPGIILFDPTNLSAAEQVPGMGELADAEGNGLGSATRSKRQRYQLDLTRLDTEYTEVGGDNQASHDEVDDEQVKRSRLRNQVIAEICSTERSYVRDIRTLHDYYIVPLEDNKHPIMEDAQIAVFFNNLRQLVMLNSKLLNDLLDIVEKRAAIMPLLSPLKAKEDGESRESSRMANRSSPTTQVEGLGAVFCRLRTTFQTVRRLRQGLRRSCSTTSRLQKRFSTRFWQIFGYMQSEKWIRQDLRESAYNAHSKNSKISPATAAHL
ncbi:hypothetical protein PINS_up010061 [Pythium insidiosum]|nr:hypothetical protein PINS_up010061 [Pythium insidiosum]